jgi:hypothetical protein
MKLKIKIFQRRTLESVKLTPDTIANIFGNRSNVVWPKVLAILTFSVDPLKPLLGDFFLFLYGLEAKLTFLVDVVDDSGVNNIKLFTDFRNKLECLVSLLSLV